jgi:hypothetical protein
MNTIMKHDESATSHTYHPIPPLHPQQVSSYAPLPSHALVWQNPSDQAGTSPATAARAGYTPNQTNASNDTAAAQRADTHPPRRGYCKSDTSATPSTTYAGPGRALSNSLVSRIPNPHDTSRKYNLLSQNSSLTPSTSVGGVSASRNNV